MSLKMVVLFWDRFILLMYRSLEKKKVVNKHHQSCLCPFKRIFTSNNWENTYFLVILSAAIGIHRIYVVPAKVKPKADGRTDRHADRWTDGRQIILPLDTDLYKKFAWLRKCCLIQRCLTLRGETTVLHRHFAPSILWRHGNAKSMTLP